MSQASVPRKLAEGRAHSPFQYITAWAVHAYTACGFVVGFLALQATIAGQAQVVFVWMLVAVLIDATDGTLARAVHVKHILPWFDGSKLDDIVDYFTFVIVPIVFLYQFQLLPATGTMLFVTIPFFASAYGFCQAEAKTADFFFTGFPSYWNIVAFYLYAIQTPVWFNGALLCFLSLFVCVPIRYIYPTRTPDFRLLTNLLGAIWVVILLVLLSQFPTPSDRLVWSSLAYPIYYTLLSFYLHKKHTKRPVTTDIGLKTQT